MSNYFACDISSNPSLAAKEYNLGIGVTFEENDRTGNVLIGIPSNYIQFDCSKNLFTALIVPSTNTATDASNFKLTTTTSDLNAFYAGCNYKYIKASAQTKSFTIPINTLVKTANQGTVSHGNLDSVSLTNAGSYEASLTDTDYDANNTYTVRVQAGHNDASTNTAIPFTIDGGILQFTKDDNLLAQDYITATLAIDLSANYSAPTLTGDHGNTNDGNDELTASVTVSTTGTSAVTASVTAIAITEEKMTALVQQVLAHDDTTVSDTIGNIRTAMASKMGSGQTFLGLMSSQQYTVTLNLDLFSVHGAAFGTNTTAFTGNDSNFSWSSMYLLINWV